MARCASRSKPRKIGGESFTKKPNILEGIAYRDTWGKGCLLEHSALVGELAGCAAHVALNGLGEGIATTEAGADRLHQIPPVAG